MFFAPTLRTYTPAARSFDRDFERFLTGAFAPATSRGLKVEQDDKAWTLSLDLPGIGRDDLVVSVEGTVVRIETKAEARRQFKAAYEVPEEIDSATTAAKLENGVLTLTLGKKVPVSNARIIDVA